MSWPRHLSGLALCAILCVAAAAALPTGALAAPEPPKAFEGGTLSVNEERRELIYTGLPNVANRIDVNQSDRPTGPNCTLFIFCTLDARGTGPSTKSEHITFTDHGAQVIRITASALALCDDDDVREDVQVYCDQAAIRKRKLRIVLDLGDGPDTVGQRTREGGFERSRLVIPFGRVDGGEGNDTIFATDESDVIRGGPGNDTIRAFDGKDQVFPDGGDDTVSLGKGNDHVFASLGTDTINGGAGTNSITYADHLAGVRIRLFEKTTTGNGSPGENDRLTNFRHATGGFGDDTILGDSRPNKISGGQGNDTVFGRGGANSVNGDAGADTLVGGSKRDVLIGGFGNDTLDGGGGPDQLIGFEGSDTVTYQRAKAGVRVTLDNKANDGLNEGKEKDRVAGSVERVIGSPHDDVLSGSARADTLEGLAGGDRLLGRDGSDALAGGAGDDRLEALDGAADSVNCGEGLADVFEADPLDTLFDCENPG